MPRDAGTPKDLWGKFIRMRRLGKGSLVISQIFVLVGTEQVGLAKYAWSTKRRASMQALIDDTKKWPDVVHEDNGLLFSCADPECAAADGVENMAPCQCRSCEAERVADDMAGVWLHKSCAANEWAAGDGGSDFVGEVGDGFVCKQCRVASRADAPAAAGAGSSSV